MRTSGRRRLAGRAMTAALAVACLGGRLELPVRASEVEEDHRLSMEFETPHTDWAQPYALGKVRVLYFGFGVVGYYEPQVRDYHGGRRIGGSEARDLIELMQRFDIEAVAAYYIWNVGLTPRQFTWSGAEAGIARILKLLKEPWDCFVFNGVRLTALPVEAQHKVYKAITEGAGLVLIDVDDELGRTGVFGQGLRPDNKITDLPPFLANDPVGDAYWMNGGQAMSLPERPQIAYRPGWEVDYDYWVERVGRAVLWAANKSPRVNLTIAPDAARIDRAKLLDNVIKVEWEGEHGPGALRLEVRLRRSDGAVFDLQPAPQSPSTYRFERRYRAGQYHVDAIASSKDGVEAWDTTPLEITASRTVAAIELDRDWGEIGETIAGTVKLNGDPLPGEIVRLQLLDARQRILVQADRPVTDSTASFEFPIEEWMPMLLEVRALVVNDEEEVSSKYAYVHVTRRNRGQFNFVVWDYPSGTLAPYAEQQLARLGCTVHLSVLALWGKPPPLAMAANDIAVIPYTTHISPEWDENGHKIPVCWNDEPAVDEWVDSIVSEQEPHRKHGALAYSIGDEIATKGACVHPACLAAYRRYLQQEYGDLAALNESWGSDYASFEQVNLLVGDEMMDDPATRSGGRFSSWPLEQEISSRWYDRQAFKAYNFVKLCERFGKRFKKLDPRAITGFVGEAGEFFDGTDIDLLCRTLGYWAPTVGPVDEVIRSIADRDLIRSDWMGYSKRANELLGKYWRMVTRGTDSVGWYRWDGGYSLWPPLLEPHMAPGPTIKEMQRDTQIVRDGLSSLLLKCRRQDDGIAILYSFPSTFINKIEVGPSYYGKYETRTGSGWEQHQAWFLALRAQGLQFSYVTDRMLRRGEFRTRDYKVLILPQAEAIGPQEAEVIRAFVESGGTVIADVRPGIYDGHCKPLADGILDDLFGVERIGNMEALVTDAQISGVLGGRAVDLSFAEVKVDPAVRVTTAQPVGSAKDVPLCLVNQVDRGRAVLLNFTMKVPGTWGSSPSPRELAGATADFVAALLALGGVEPEVTVTDLAGNPVRDTEVIRWRGEGVDFVALLGSQLSSRGSLGDAAATDEMVQVHLPDVQHVYDLREHVYRGRTASFTAQKMSRRATFIALSTQQLSGPQMDCRKTTIPRGEQLTVQLSYPGSPAYHAARLRVYQPGGAHAEWLDQVVMVGPEGARVTLPIAFNDPVGRWTVEAIDLYTEKTTTTEYMVK